MEILEQIYGAFCDASTLEGPLKARLRSFHSNLIEIVPPLDDAYENSAERFCAAYDDKNIPSVGDPMQNFVLPNDRNGLTSLNELLDRGPCIISFNRGHWCFHCMLELHALAGIASDVDALGGHLVSIVPERVAFNQKITAICDLSFPVLSDIDNGVASSMDLVMSARQDLRPLFVSAGLDIAEFQGNEGWFLPIPATFIVDQSGTICARFVDPDFRTRSEPAEIVETFRSITASRS